MFRAGRVTDAGGEPVAGAQIRLTRFVGRVEAEGEAPLEVSRVSRNNERVVYTRADGFYRVERVEPGEYTLEVRSPGFRAKTIDGVVVGDTPLRLDAALASGGRIRGRVVDTAGAPIRDVEVVAFVDLEGAREGERDRQVLRTLRFTGPGRGIARTPTDEKGRYTLKRLPEGEYTVMARKRGFLPAEAPSLQPGEQVPDLVLRRLASLRGVVRAASTREPIPEYRLQVRWQSRGGRAILGLILAPQDSCRERG